MSLDLAKRLSRAPIGSDELDLEINRTLSITAGPVPNYTGSLDTALSLVPAEYDWIIGRTNGGLTIHAQLGPDQSKIYFGETPALAVCAAAIALRAEGEK